MIESDIVECVITLVGNLFYGAGVSACILFLNNNKPAAHRGKICLIDGSTMYTPQRAKNIMTEFDVQKVYDLWLGYKDVIDKCAIADMDRLRENKFTLAVNSYIDKSPAPPIDPQKVCEDFMSALQRVKDCESRLMQLLQEGGYIDG